MEWLLKALYKEYGFSMWLKQLGEIQEPEVVQEKEIVESPTQEKTTNLDIDSYSQSLILNEDDFSLLLTKLSNSEVFVFDLETNSLDYMQAEIVGLVFLIEKESYYIPIGHDYLDAPVQLSRQRVMDALKPIL